LVKKLKTKISQDVVKVLFDQAVLSEGGQLKEPAEFVKRMNKLMGCLGLISRMGLVSGTS
jgi:molecular chaperone HtpG